MGYYAHWLPLVFLVVRTFLVPPFAVPCIVCVPSLFVHRFKCVALLPILCLSATTRWRAYACTLHVHNVCQL